MAINYLFGKIKTGQLNSLLVYNIFLNEIVIFSILGRTPRNPMTRFSATNTRARRGRPSFQASRLL